MRRPGRLKPFREGLPNRFLGNLERWFLAFCCKASLETVIGRVG